MREAVASHSLTITALGNLADVVEKTARDSFASSRETWEEDYEANDPEEYRIWKAAKLEWERCTQPDIDRAMEDHEKYGGMSRAEPNG